MEDNTGTRVNFKLGQVEQVLLTAIQVLEDEANTPNIIKWVETNTHLTLHNVTAHTMLIRLEPKGIVSVKKYKLGNRRRSFYSLTEEGKRILDDAFNFQAYLAHLYDGIKTK